MTQLTSSSHHEDGMTSFNKFAVTAGSAAVFFVVLILFVDIDVTPTTKLTAVPGQSVQGFGSLDLTSDRRRRVLLVTYGRSGSSFTSAIIRLDPQVFHFFEPLYPLNTMSREKFIQHQDYSFHLWGPPMQEESVAWIQSFLNCRPTNVTAVHNDLFNNRDHTREMYKCVNDRMKDGWNHIGCYIQMIDDCLSKGVTFIKTIRFRLKWSEELMEKNPNLSVIYLVRDPRAVLHSQSRVFGRNWFDWQRNISSVAPTFCQEFDSDLQDFHRLSATYPQQFKLIRYEDGAMNPHQFTRDIFSFLKLPYTNVTEDSVTAMTTRVNKRVKRNSIEFSTHRDNPVLAMQKWRYSAGYSQSLEVDKYCGHLYPLLGYRSIESEKDLLGNRTLVLDSFQDKS